MPPGQGAWLARLQRTAEELGIIPAGLRELEFNVTPTRILSAEYWSGLPRTEANHTVVVIPKAHQSTFDDFAVEFRSNFGVQRCVHIEIEMDVGRLKI